MRKKYIYICSPLRGNVKRNIENARCICREIVELFPDVTPIAPHIYCTQVLDDSIPWERKEGMEMAISLLEKCDELWVFGINQVSAGMRQEINYATEHGIKVRDATNGYKGAVVLKTKSLTGEGLDLYAWQECKIKRKPGESDKKLCLRCRRSVMNPVITTSESMASVAEAMAKSTVSLTTAAKAAKGAGQ